MYQGQLQNQQTVSYLQSKYLCGTVSLPGVIETIKQKILAYSNKLRRYTARGQSFHQNRQFQNDQRKFYEALTSPHRHAHKVQSCSSDLASEILQFWNSLWGNQIVHNTQAGWISRVKELLNDIVPQQRVSITHEKVLSATKKLKNCRAAGLDGIQNFWLKYFKSLHHRLALQFQNILDDGEIPKWLAHGRTVLIMKKRRLVQVW